jgi:hypothetical protein
MSDPGTSFAYKLAARLFDSAFEACERLPPKDKQLLLQEIAKRILQQLPSPEDQKAVKVIGIEIK